MHSAKPTHLPPFSVVLQMNSKPAVSRGQPPVAAPPICHAPAALRGARCDRRGEACRCRQFIGAGESRCGHHGRAAKPGRRRTSRPTRAGRRRSRFRLRAGAIERGRGAVQANFRICARRKWPRPQRRTESGGVRAEQYRTSDLRNPAVNRVLLASFHERYRTRPGLDGRRRKFYRNMRARGETLPSLDAGRAARKTEIPASQSKGNGGRDRD